MNNPINWKKSITGIVMLFFLKSVQCNIKIHFVRYTTIKKALNQMIQGFFLRRVRDFVTSLHPFIDKRFAVASFNWPSIGHLQKSGKILI